MFLLVILTKLLFMQSSPLQNDTQNPASAPPIKGMTSTHDKQIGQKLRSVGKRRVERIFGKSINKQGEGNLKQRVAEQWKK